VNRTAIWIGMLPGEMSVPRTMADCDLTLSSCLSNARSALKVLHRLTWHGLEEDSLEAALESTVRMQWTYIQDHINFFIKFSLSSYHS
jgi:hypothetical protein